MPRAESVPLKRQADGLWLTTLRLTPTINNHDQKAKKQMTKTPAMNKDPVCGMTVDETSALHAQRDGKTFYFCSEHCRQKFLSTSVGQSARKNPAAGADKVIPPAGRQANKGTL